MLIMSLGLSAISLGCLFLFNRKKCESLFLPVFLGLVCAIGPICVFSGFLPGYIVSFFIGLIALAIWKRDILPRYSTVPLILIAIFVGHLVPYLLVVRSDMQRYDEIREAIVPLNIDERLNRPAKPSIESVLDLSAAEDLEASVQELTHTSSRKFYFAKLHESRVSHFVNNPGFGVMRILFPVREKEFYLPTRTPISQPRMISTSQARSDIDHPVDPEYDPRDFHRKTTVEFAYPIGWGWERSPNEYLGFQPHQLGNRSKHEMFSEEKLELHLGLWRIASLELIGLLAHPKPTVYMTANLPRMDEAKTAPTREPDEFESAGLKAIAKGQELYFGRSRTEPLLRMVGGIRAAKSCVNCHGCREGELLGAFSYTLVK